MQKNSGIFLQISCFFSLVNFSKQVRPTDCLPNYFCYKTHVKFLFFSSSGHRLRHPRDEDDPPRRGAEGVPLRQDPGGQGGRAHGHAGIGDAAREGGPLRTHRLHRGDGAQQAGHIVPGGEKETSRDFEMFCFPFSVNVSSSAWMGEGRAKETRIFSCQDQNVFVPVGDFSY